MTPAILDTLKSMCLISQANSAMKLTYEKKKTKALCVILRRHLFLYGLNVLFPLLRVRTKVGLSSLGCGTRAAIL